MKLLSKNKLLEHLEEYVQVRYQIAKLDGEERLFRMVVAFVITGTFLLTLGIFVLFLNLALVHYLNKVIFANHFWGYLSVAGLQFIFFLFFLLLIRTSKNGIYRIVSKVVHNFFKIVLDLVFENDHKKNEK